MQKNIKKTVFPSPSEPIPSGNHILPDFSLCLYKHIHISVI